MQKEVLLVGNPNAGKSTLFNQLTGLKQHVGNFPGITVEKKFGSFNSSKYQDKFQVVDLPGVYSLVGQQQTSEDERVTLKYLLNSTNSIVLNVIDATCLERHLYLTLQLKELGLPMIIILNKWDMVEQSDLQIDVDTFAKELDCKVLTISSSKQIDIDEIAQAADAVATPEINSFKIEYNAETEQKLSASQNRFVEINNLIDQQYLGNISTDVELDVASMRYQRCNEICQNSIIQTHQAQHKLTEKLDHYFMRPIVALPLFLLSMYLMFMFAINVGGAFIDFFDIAAGAILVDGLAHLLNSWSWPQWLVVLLTDGVGAGIQTVATFIPLIFCLYLFLTALEQTGYLARAAVVTDRLMQKVGLPGSAFVPMIMGFGCTVPAVMATRTLKQKHERILAGAMSHFMVCGARLPVFALFAAAFFLENALHVVFLLYILGICAAVLTGIVFRRTVIKGEASPFVIELPQYQLPHFADLMHRTWQRVKSFVFGAGKTIVIMVTLLGIFNSLGKDGSFGNTGTDNSLLAVASQTITPAFAPMGIEEDNWQATVGIFTGLFAKEVLVATLNSLYQDNEESNEEFDLGEQLNEAVASIGDNLMGIAELVLDPLGLTSADVASVEEAAETQEVSMTTMERLASHFDGKHGAFAYLLFILLYAPCASALGAIAREFNGRWAFFIALWTTALAYIVAASYYQVVTWTGLQSSQTWTLAVILIVSVIIYRLMKLPQLADWLDRGVKRVKTNSNATCH
ncbi:ferrous iron transport protein B [Thalassomonas sp. M1454]|uniref:ferrous iron transport protein B n=1 Tax=Thalassomonas sp. M1454 TaxID=2594477 RepID=UPI00117F63E8|nr:ferrous iron transport protein B [Thalassomonas sp. M1454]TRX56353.1 ferrous iron transport protein B [Thalassomonas sp. M1454]